MLGRCFYLTAPLAVNKIYAKIPSVQAQAPTAPNLKMPAFLLNQLGVKQLSQRKYREALETFQELLEVYQQIGDRPGCISNG